MLRRSFTTFPTPGTRLTSSKPAVPRVAGTLGKWGFYIPKLVVQVSLPGTDSFELTAIVDSGADMSIFPAEELEAHGLQVDAWPSIGPGKGVGENCDFEIRRGEGELRWKKWVFATNILVAEAGALQEGLLGREDFFKTFAVNLAGWRSDPPWMVIEHYSGSSRRRRPTG